MIYEISSHTASPRKEIDPNHHRLRSLSFRPEEGTPRRRMGNATKR